MTPKEWLLLLVLIVLLDWALTVWRRPPAQPPSEVKAWQVDNRWQEQDEDRVHYWHIADLAEAHRAAQAAGCVEARDRIERVLEDIEPAWRTYG